MKNETGRIPPVPYLKDEQFEARAEYILECYSKHYGGSKEPPVPIDDIVEFVARFDINIDDLGHGIHGYTDVESKSIYIDKSLDPHEFLHLEVRYRSTLAHELFHGLSHKKHGIQCRHPEEALHSVEDPHVRRAEWQARRGAACILMPRKMVREEWPKIRRDVNQRPFEELDNLGPAPNSNGEFGFLTRTFDEAVDATALKECAEKFLVSQQAMAIRLETLGLRFDV